MILSFNYEELSALREGARALLAHGEEGGAGGLLAPPATRAGVEALLPRLTGVVVVDTLADQRELEEAVRAIADCLRSALDFAIVVTHPADEFAVSAYFDYAHTLSVLARLKEIGSEMEALIEVVTGEQGDTETASTFHFPD